MSTNDSSPLQARIDTSTLIPGRGTPLKNATCIFDTHVRWVGPTRDLPGQHRHLEAQKVETLMPGLWDAHVHYFGARKISIDEIYRTPPAAAGARIAQDLRDTLNAGYTSVRELGGWGYQIKDAVNEGTIPGPSIYSSVAPISMTGGHGDAHDTPLPVVKAAIESYGLPLYICDGVDECIKAVRQQLRRGASCIKVLASGGCTSLVDDPEHRQFSDEELRAMVAEAERSERIVSAHCHGKAGIMAALNAGCKTIEHGTYLDSECLALMKSHNAILIATRNFFAGGLLTKPLWPAPSYQKLQHAAATHLSAYKLAIASGVKIALGTDLGVSGSIPILEPENARVFSHGSNARELGLAVDAGMTPLQAIEASTINACKTLGPQAPRKGLLEVGWEADLLGLEGGDVLKDIKVLMEERNVKWIWKAGRAVKEEGKLVG